ncbi:serine/threonine protein kinase [Rhodopirellula sp. MGV]|uniref:serine/threonine protein kinase n=1 Tax=Rhodopirellula sp. MGV TaxID=2023130 RepID=UPI000B9608B9|nr:serine/threonine-protein kinase [Rhodopirellula sp. MGV]OYP39100.1 hypothetical protein CGZ80_00160 [Rhodopirellula sp. MGV]
MSGSVSKHDFLDPPKEATDDLGTLGHYRVIRELGKGGMGYVFLAEDGKLKRQVALKVMNQKIASTPGSRKRFISEARTMAAVHHDNVATIFEVGEHKGTPFMAMELLQGNTLEDYRETHGEPDFRTIISFARDMARGLAAAHQRGIIHRDIKPANIWLDTQTNRIKILDFGLALAQTPVDQLSGRGAVVGTPGYLSPEQARSEPLDDRSDLYSTGVVLYELATGTLPLKSKSVAEQLIAILVHHPVPVRERNEKIPQPLADLIAKLMAKEPRKRYDSAAEFEACLDDVEKECESKSEMALAISQLQAGLEQAVGKKTVDEDPFAESAPNPFEALPDNLPAATIPQPTPQAASTPDVFASASPTVAPAAGPTASGLSGQTSKPLSKAAASSSISTSKLIIIGVAIVAVLLLAMIPAVVYFSASNAIARQQDVTTIPSRNADAAQTNDDNSSPQPAPSEPVNRPRNSPNRSAQTFAMFSSLPSIPTTEPDNLGGKAFTALVNDKKANGSFEDGNGSGLFRIPNWTAQLLGESGGWNRSLSPREIDGDFYAFAGKQSEVVLTSDPLNYNVKRGDILRLGLNVGGEGKGVSDFFVAIGFRNDRGVDTKFQIDRVNLGNAWSAKQPKRLRYEFTVDPSVVDQRPFIQIGLSNLNRVRDMAIVDRVILNVRSNTPAPVTSPPKTPNTTPALNPPQSPPRPTEATATATTPQKVDDSQLRIVTLTTSSELGSDATVRRSGSANDPLGSSSSLVVQTRNNRQIQHVYLRFPLELIGNPSNNRQPQNRGGDSAPVKKAALRVQLTEPVQQNATVQLYGLDDPISDLWPEDKLVWSNSLSSAGLEKLPKLGEVTLDPKTRELVISSAELASFLAKCKQKTVTLILTGSQGDELVKLAAREDDTHEPPTVVVGLER